MKKTRTAAYCRVSTTSDTQDGSFEVQCEYYERLIRSDPEMEFVGVYGDHGKSDGKGNETGKPYGSNPKGGNGVTPDSGYKFTGFYTYVITKPDGTTETGRTDNPASVVVTGDIVFTPEYQKVPWATWVDPATGRTIKVPTDFADGEEPPAPANPTRPGYNFDGWDRSVDDEGNVTYTAKWVA